jgi:hypothetical protein
MDLLDLDEPQLPMPGLTPRLPQPSLTGLSAPPKPVARPASDKPRRASKSELASGLAESMGLELVRLQRVLHDTLGELEAIRALLR